jgi:hypothetical protein
MEHEDADELRQSRAGDPRITPEGREILKRIVMRDLADEFADALAESCAEDSLLGGDGPLRSR